jgi:sulfhydrogenase subunit beta (sulfur reductase)
MSVPNGDTHPQSQPLKITRSQWSQMLEALVKEHYVIGPKTEGSHYIFDHVTERRQIALVHDRTYCPIRSVFMPAELIGPDKAVQIPPDKQLILLGLHPCDVRALAAMDRYLVDEAQCRPYAELRKRTLVIGYNCLPDEQCHCRGPWNQFAAPDFDLTFTDIGFECVVRIGTEAGDTLLKQFGFAQPLSDSSSEVLWAMNFQCMDKMMYHLKQSRAEQALQDKDPAELIRELIPACADVPETFDVCPTNFPPAAGESPEQLIEANLQVLRGRVDDGLLKEVRRCYEDVLGRYKVAACVGCGRCLVACPDEIAVPFVFLLKRVAEQAAQARKAT